MNYETVTASPNLPDPYESTTVQVEYTLPDPYESTTVQVEYNFPDPYESTTVQVESVCESLSWEPRSGPFRGSRKNNLIKTAPRSRELGLFIGSKSCTR